jgi:hypothetical protein
MEAFNVAILRWCSWSYEVQSYILLRSPLIHIDTNELWSIVARDGFRIPPSFFGTCISPSPTYHSAAALEEERLEDVIDAFRLSKLAEDGGCLPFLNWPWRVFAVFAPCISAWVEIWAGCTAKRQS